MKAYEELQKYRDLLEIIKDDKNRLAEVGFADSLGVSLLAHSGEIIQKYVDHFIVILDGYINLSKGVEL